MSMRERFYSATADLLDRDDRTAVVIAEIGSAQLAAAGARADRVINVGIREQLMVATAAGLALSGFRPIVHSYAPFVVERPYEMLKLDLGHQDLGAVLVSVGASYDSAASGRTHQTPEDVAVVAALPGWHVYVPGHEEEAERLFRHAVGQGERAYVRLAERSNERRRDVEPGRIVVDRRGRAATIVVVGPLLDAVNEATADLDVSVLYATTVRPFDRASLRANAADLVVLVEPYLEGTSAVEMSAALVDVPHRLVCVGVPNVEHRRYGTWREHDAAHGLDAAGLRARIGRALAAHT